MSILIYKNNSDKDLKRLFSIPDEVNKSVSEVDITIFNGRNKDRFYEQLSRFTTVIFVTHGDPNNIYHSLFDDDKLIELGNIQLLDSKKVISISCCTAKELGKSACNNECLVFLGMRHKLHMDIQDKNIIPEIHYINFVETIYKDVFSKCLVEAINKDFTFNKLKNMLEIELSREVQRKSDELKSCKARLYETNKIQYSIPAVLHVVNNILVHGNDQLKILD